MRKRIFAALVAASMICWSMAPLVASSWTMRTASQRAGTESSSPAHQHSCCPGIQSSPVLLATLPPMTMPCGDRHPCCVQQGPENSPALPAVKNSARPDLRHLPAASGDPDLGAPHENSNLSAARHTFQFYSDRSTVLRI